MKHFKLWGKCKGCKENRLFIKTRTLPTPAGNVHSHDLFCQRCYNKIKKVM